MKRELKLMDSCWIVYTHDVRFSPMRIDSVFTDEHNAQLRVAFLNADDLSRGTPLDVRQSHAVEFNLRTEALID